MNAFTQSRYNILVPLRHGRTLAYNSMSGATAVWERDDRETFERIALGEEFDEGRKDIVNLLYGGFIVRNGVDELQILRREYDAQRNSPATMILTIAPTLMCNFGCDYCFQGADKPSGSMRQEVQDAAIAVVDRAATTARHLHIAWYGGEPLLAQPVIESLSDRLIALCGRRGVGYDAMIVTNGYRLTADVAQSLHERRVRTAQVTLDGPADCHDQRRNLLGGQPTFHRIIENLQSVVHRALLQISVRINVDSRNAPGVCGLLDHLREMGFANRKNFGVYFAPVEAITEGCHNVADVCISKFDYGQLEVDLTRYAFQAGLTSLPYPPRFRGICGAVRPNAFVIGPNGDVHKCWDTVSMPERRVGTVFDLDRLERDERVLQWTQWTPFQNETCSNCKILPNCAGSCPHKFINPEAALGEAGRLPCPSWKYNIHERLIMMAERAGAVARDDYDPENIRTDPKAICSVPYPEMFTSARGRSQAFVPLESLMGQVQMKAYV